MTSPVANPDSVRNSIVRRSSARISPWLAQRQHDAPRKHDHHAGAQRRGQVRVNMRHAHFGQQRRGRGKYGGEQRPANPATCPIMSSSSWQSAYAPLSPRAPLISGRCQYLPLCRRKFRSQEEPSSVQILRCYDLCIPSNQYLGGLCETAPLFPWGPARRFCA